MDIPWAYRWGMYTQHLPPKEIAKMKKNMKKVPVIQLKSDIYHTQEIHEAENILENISSLPKETTLPTETQTQNNWYIWKIRLLRQRFISLF